MVSGTRCTKINGPGVLRVVQGYDLVPPTQFGVVKIGRSARFKGEKLSRNFLVAYQSGGSHFYESSSREDTVDGWGKIVEFFQIEACQIVAQLLWIYANRLWEESTVSEISFFLSSSR
ncbi:hypothetical protein CEXT_67671 [Caerostris extrusa]|uniref:Uncharacterized protein n=1 Tax=Caerostris extrusa TaxID=172846 RepID=A0AAV4MQK3_CAEEX|nr:hypothetical protein CEXT_67671 [Caerostris extrusa]